MNIKYNLLKTYGGNSLEFQLFQTGQDTLSLLLGKYPNDPQISAEYIRRTDSDSAPHESGISLELLIFLLNRYPEDREFKSIYQKRKDYQIKKYNPIIFYGSCALMTLTLILSIIFPQKSTLVSIEFLI